MREARNAKQPQSRRKMGATIGATLMLMKSKRRHKGISMQ